MALSYVIVPDGSVGNLLFIGHEETLFEGRGNNRKAVSEVYLLASDKLGTITVTVPTENGVTGSFFRKKVELSNLKVISSPYQRVNQSTGSMDVRVRDILHAEKISVEGARK